MTMFAGMMIHDIGKMIEMIIPPSLFLALALSARIQSISPAKCRVRSTRKTIGRNANFPASSL
jgi:hypothetical protein